MVQVVYGVALFGGIFYCGLECAVMAANYEKLKMYKIVYRVEILGTGCVVRPNPTNTTDTSSPFDPKITFLVSLVRHDLPPFCRNS